MLLIELDLLEDAYFVVLESSSLVRAKRAVLVARALLINDVQLSVVLQFIVRALEYTIAISVTAVSFLNMVLDGGLLRQTIVLNHVDLWHAFALNAPPLLAEAFPYV